VHVDGQPGSPSAHMTDLRMVPVARRRSEQHTTPDHAGSTPTRASRWCHPLGRHGIRTTCTRTERQLNPYFCHLKSGWPRRPPAWEVRFRRFVVFGRPSGGPQALRRVLFALGRPGVGPWTHHPPAVGARRRPAPMCRAAPQTRNSQPLPVRRQTPSLGKAVEVGALGKSGTRNTPPASDLHSDEN
jgi:hypothetical protein